MRDVCMTTGPGPQGQCSSGDETESGTWDVEMDMEMDLDMVAPGEGQLRSAHDCWIWAGPRLVT
jgi:hypothetical protein